MEGIRVLHVIEQLRPGGPLQALIAATKQSSPPARFEHHIVSLRPADRRAGRQAGQAGIAGTSAPDGLRLRQLVTGADIVQAHFWNGPDIHAFLSSDLPPVRLLAWCHVNGAAPPHVIPRSVLERCDLVVATARCTLGLPAFRGADPARVAVVESSADFSRVSGVRPVGHEGFHVGYVGRVDFAKLHPAFARMCAAVEVPSARFIVCGDGGAVRRLVWEVSGLGLRDRFEFRGHVEAIGPILARLDVFGYPLVPDTSATAELALQEAMYAGIPPVVFAHGAPGSRVTDGDTGIVVATEAGYVAAIEWLHRNPHERRRLGANAARAMRRSSRRTDGQSEGIYLRLLERPKRPRARAAAVDPPSESSGAPSSRTSWSFVRSLDGVGDGDFLASLTASDAAAQEAELRIAGAPTALQDVVLQYRLHDPDDPHLRLWTGLILRGRGRPAVAASEFMASLRLGCAGARIHRYFLESAAAAGVARVAS